ncbi:proteasome assembly chaperone 4 [Iris pallida]|uniref:Proteasome assembly chaperone 4 n=1 Tax=Iris pallida TaxID=29817 RepID=A0AAX6I3X7_IRIPA|nr:proteasome assembly chaperone 4 [Iris pallida]KAJ6847778.1 proteasome assembly chaperone 4 [Iris pallida]
MSRKRFGGDGDDSGRCRRRRWWWRRGIDGGGGQRVRVRQQDLSPPEQYVGCYSLLEGTSDNTGSSIAHRLVPKTGLSVILACNPKDSPMLEHFVI